MEEALAKTLASFQHLRAEPRSAPKKMGGVGRVLLALALLAAAVAALVVRSGKL